MNVSLFIARRLSLGSKEAPKVGEGVQSSPAVGVAIAGIALSVAIMMLTLAIVPGFKHQITRKVMGFDAQVTMHPVGGSASFDGSTISAFKITDNLRASVEAAVLPTADDAGVDFTIRLSGILKTDDHFAGLVFKAFDGNGALDFVNENLEEGVVPDYSDVENDESIVISRVIANELGLAVGDGVYGYFFNNDRLRARKFKVAAIYNTHFNEYDKLLGVMSISQARRLGSLEDDEATAIEVRGLDVHEIPEIRQRFQEVSTDAFYSNDTNCYMTVSDVYEQDPMYFNWLDLLDTNVVVILVLMGCVSAVTLISCLVIMILERVRLVGILKALGTDNGMVSKVFMYMAQRVVLRGLLVGDCVALLLMLLQWRYKLIPLDPEAYYLNAVPIEFDWSAFILLNIGALILSVLILMVPSRLVARISPARVMKFE